jgi:uncharacterized protein (DUF58 family)
MNNKSQTLEAEQRFHVSILFGKEVLWAELLLLIVLIYFHIVSLIVFVIFMLAINLLVIVWKKKALSQVLPSIKITRSRVFARQEIELSAEIVNNKYLPLTWLEWESENLRGITWPGQESSYRIRLLWILWKQSAVWSITVQADRRGVYPIGRITLRSGDGFRFTEEEQKFDLKENLYVYPLLMPVTAPSLLTSQRLAMQGRNGGFLEDPLLVNGIREYQPGDEWRRISWQASARTGILQTKVYQPIRLQAVSFFVDVSGFADLNQEEKFERLLSIVASTALAYSEQRISVGFATNGVNHEDRPVHGSLPTQSLTAMMDEIAGLMPRCTGQLPVPPFGNAPLFFFCDQIGMSHVKWIGQLSRDVSVFFYTCKESREEGLIKQCSIQRVDALLRGTAG